MYIKLQGKKRQPLGTLFSCKQKDLLTVITGCMFQKIAMLSDFMHIFFMILYIYIALGQGQTAQFRAKILMTTGRPHHYGHLLPV